MKLIELNLLKLEMGKILNHINKEAHIYKVVLLNFLNIVKPPLPTTFCNPFTKYVVRRREHNLDLFSIILDLLYSIIQMDMDV